MKHYRWPDNVHLIPWKFNENSVEKYRQLNYVINNLSKCGDNLIIIDELVPEDLDTIEEIRKDVENFENLTTVFVVTIPNYNEHHEAEYNSKILSISSLEKLEKVYFKEFKKDDVRRCILKIIKDNNFVIDEKDIEDIVNGVNPKSGCKKIESKTVAFNRNFI